MKIQTVNYRTADGWGGLLDTGLDGACPRSGHLCAAGIYACGEISLAVPGGVSELHDQTMTATVFSET